MQTPRQSACMPEKPVARAGARHAVGMRQSMPSAALIEVARKISIVMRIKKSVHNTLAT